MKVRSIRRFVMTDLERCRQLFVEALDLDPADFGDPEYGKTPGWDSVGHMGLVSALEDAFGIMLDPEDIFAMSSYSGSLDVLRKYGIGV